LTGHPDSDIAAVCLQELRAIVTLDLDFGDIRGYPPADYPGIVVLSRPNFARYPVLGDFFSTQEHSRWDDNVKTENCIGGACSSGKWPECSQFLSTRIHIGGQLLCLEAQAKRAGRRVGPTAGCQGNLGRAAPSGADPVQRVPGAGEDSVATGRLD